MPYPNHDEAARWGKMCGYLSQIPDLRGRRGALKPLRILDVGCGRGWLTNLANAYGSCDGVEPVPSSIEMARTYYPHLNLKVGTTADVLSAPDFVPYDVVVTSEVIEHVEDKETFVREIRECLAPGGHVIITTPRAEEFERFQRVVPRAEMQPVEEWISEDELRALFVRHDFKMLDHDRAYVPFCGMSSLHDFCARYGNSRKLDRLNLKWFLRGLQYMAAIYQVWWFQLGDAAAQSYSSRS